MESTNDIIGMAALAGGFVAVVYILARYTYLIKKAMIENGMQLGDAGSKLKYIDAGCILVGLGVGFLISAIYTEMNLTEDTTDLLAWGTIIICGGLGLLVAHKMRSRRN